MSQVAETGGVQVRNRTHATSKLSKRKLENLIQNQSAHQINKLAYNSFEDPSGPTGEISGPNMIP